MIYMRYLLVMSAIVVLIAAVSIPSLFWPRCAACKRRTWVANGVCSHCGAVLPDDLDL